MLSIASGALLDIAIYSKYKTFDVIFGRA